MACNEWAGTENVKLSIQNAGLKHLRLVPGCGAEPDTLRRMLREASVVVCSSLVAGKIRGMAPRGAEIIVDDRRLDRAGIEASVKLERLDHLVLTVRDEGRPGHSVLFVPGK